MISPALDLELEAEEDAPQTSLHIAQGRCHKVHCAPLQDLLKSAPYKHQAIAAVSGDADKGGSAAKGGAAETVPAPSSEPAAKATKAANKALVQADSSTSGGAGEIDQVLVAPAVAKKATSTAEMAKRTAVQWDGNMSLTNSELLLILFGDGWAFVGAFFACRLLLKDLLRFGRVNKALWKIHVTICTSSFSAVVMSGRTRVS